MATARGATTGDDASYAAALAAKNEGKPREALRLLRSLRSSRPSSPRVAARIQEAIDVLYGPKGSDGTLSVWKDAPLMSRAEPKLLHGAAFAQARGGRKIYRHGGREFVDGFRAPSDDALWEFDVDGRTWRRLKMITGANSPGPRSGHTAFVWQDDLYLWGGMDRTTSFCSKLYRLRNATRAGDTPLRWEVVRTGSRKPPGREEHAGVLYKGKYYVSGGQGALVGTGDSTDDLWALNLSNMKWSALKRGPVARHAHGMWAANDKLYILGGRVRVAANGDDPSIEDFVSYDISAKTWTYEDIVGGDRPYDLSEFTVLPLYKNDLDHDPTSVVVWGGYGEYRHSDTPPTHETLKTLYGNDYQDFAIGNYYRRRLLRFDVESNVWKKLTPTTDILPKAQSFATVSRCEKGVLRLLIGGGYSAKSRMYDPLFDEAMGGIEVPAEVRSGSCPLASNKVYEVSITEAFGDLGQGKSGWSWDLYNTCEEEKPAVTIDRTPFSPTLHHATYLTHEDFLAPSVSAVSPNDEVNLLGVRVKLLGLKGRKELNDRVGRCGCWCNTTRRYQVHLFPSHVGSAFSVLVKPQNLTIVKAMDAEDFGDLMKSEVMMNAFPSVIMSVLAQGTKSGKVARPIIQEFLDPPKESDSRVVFPFLDTYRGPVSARAQSILRTVAESLRTVAESPCEDSVSLHCFFVAATIGKPENSEQAKRVQIFARYANFVRRLRDEDSLRARSFEKIIAKIDDSQVEAVCGKWLRVKVTLDGIRPAVQRELLVSPEMTIKCLHDQVLCPAMGWKPNCHCYAFRTSGFVSLKKKDIESVSRSELYGALQMANNECWIGAKKSTAVDSMFMPLFVGGAMASDEKISLGQLFVLKNDEDDALGLQWVHDFGDWWSHSISVTKYGHDDVPSKSTVVHLVGGKGGSIPDKSGGILKYVKKIRELTGGQHDPSHESWWTLVDENSKRLDLLSNPLEFNIEKTRTDIEIAIRSPKQKAGRENIIPFNILDPTGLQHGYNKKRTVSLPQGKTKLCAVCGVTVALKVCTRCSSVAYCSRKHQLEHWGAHKSECKLIQRKNERKKREQ